MHLRDVIFHLKRCLLILLPDDTDNQTVHLQQLARRAKGGLDRHQQAAGNDEWRRFKHRYHMAQNLQVPMVACGEVQMHSAKRKALHDVLTAIRLQTPVQQLGHRRLINSQQHLRTLDTLHSLYPETLIGETRHIADRASSALMSCAMSIRKRSYRHITLPTVICDRKSRPVPDCAGQTACRRPSRRASIRSSI